MGNLISGRWSTAASITLRPEAQKQTARFHRFTDWPQASRLAAQRRDDRHRLGDAVLARMLAPIQPRAGAALRRLWLRGPPNVRWSVPPRNGSRPNPSARTRRPEALITEERHGSRGTPARSRGRCAHAAVVNNSGNGKQPVGDGIEHIDPNRASSFRNRLTRQYDGPLPSGPGPVGRDRRNLLRLPVALLPKPIYTGGAPSMQKPTEPGRRPFGRGNRGTSSRSRASRHPNRPAGA
jgi:hypothetical protein